MDEQTQKQIEEIDKKIWELSHEKNAILRQYYREKVLKSEKDLEKEQ